VVQDCVSLAGSESVESSAGLSADTVESLGVVVPTSVLVSIGSAVLFSVEPGVASGNP
jgi:hypothetical protein